MRRPLAVFLVLAGVLLLATGRERPYGDARIVYEVATSLVKDQTIAIKSEWPPMSHKGADGRVYSQYAILPSLAHVPGRAFFATFWNEREEGTPSGRLALVLTSHVVPACSIALACALLFAAASRLASRRAALVTTGCVAFGSLAFVYARYPMSEAVQAACVMGFVVELVRVVSGDHARRRGIVLGLWAGAVVNAKTVLLLGALGGLGAAAILVRERAALKQLAIGAVLGGLPWLVTLLVYNQLRWGSPIETGYGETLGMMRESMPSGLLGLLVSPGKGLLWFSPLVLLCVIALARTWSEHRRIAIVVLAVVIPPLLFYARFLSWSGDYCWGPRYLVYAIAPLALLLAPWLDRARGRVATWLVRLVIGWSIAIQLLGASLFWDHWIRLSREAHLAWLGNPNRKGAAIEEKGRGHCDSCFEDMFGHQWLPPLSPIAGHLWLARHHALGSTYDDARLDAPWSRYTTLPLPSVKTHYDQVRFDWWALEAESKSAPLAIGFGVLCVMLVAGGIVLWRRRTDEPA